MRVVKNNDAVDEFLKNNDGRDDPYMWNYFSSSNILEE